MPIVLAIFLTFVLTPLVGCLQRYHLPRSLAVLSSVSLAFAIVFSLSMMVLTQLRQLTDDLPKYQTTLNDKVRDLRETLVGSGLIIKGSTMLKDMTKALDAGPAAPASLAEHGNSSKPVPVEVHQPEPGSSDTLVAVLSPLITPMTTTAIVVIFVIFFLFQREDLRNRFIRVLGTRDLERTTSAMDDAGQRLARYFLMQLLINSVFGITIGGSLAFIGVPSAALWGLLAAILRFVPYLGAPLAAILPITLAAAIEPGWGTVIWTTVMFLVVETLTGQVVEPLVYGKSAGLSPVAIVISAAFWAWLWGPIGLLISTPLTLCLVVMARHVEGLEFVEVMLGDQPALSPPQATYQRMLAGDLVEAIEHALPRLKEMPILEYYQQILLGALVLAQQDAERKRLDEKRLENIQQTVAEMIDEFRDHKEFGSGTTPNKTEAVGKAESRAAAYVHSDEPVTCAPGFSKLDRIAAMVIADALERQGIRTQAFSTRKPRRDHSV